MAFQSELVSFLDERVHMMEGEAMGTVPAAVFAGTDNALANCMAEVGLLVYVTWFAAGVAVSYALRLFAVVLVVVVA